MDDMIARLKDWKTTSFAAAVFAVQFAKDLGYTLTISVDDLSNYIVYIIAGGFLLAGGGKSNSTRVILKDETK